VIQPLQYYYMRALPGWCTMKILVLSDSHAGLSFMRRCVAVVKPDAIVHLGDYYDDGCVLAEENPGLVIHQVPGNCDRYRCPENSHEVLCYDLDGVRCYMTHGHKHQVKLGIGGLLADARRWEAKAVLYGHTHKADCHKEPDGLWVLNPGSCGSWGGTVAVMETGNGEIIGCRILSQADLEEMV